MGRHAADQGPHLGALMTDETDETGPFGGSVDSASLYDAGQLARIAYLNFMCGNNPQPTSYQPAAKCAYCSLVAGIAAGDPEPVRADFIWLLGAGHKPVGSEKMGICRSPL